MEYLHRHVTKHTDATELLPGARSIIVCAQSYNQQAPNRAATVREREIREEFGERREERSEERRAKSERWGAQNAECRMQNGTTDGADRATGRVAMYAWGDDYHDVLKRKLFAVADRLHERISEPFETKVCVDTAPLLEREYAMRAGIGWIGKNTLVLNERLGSYFVLGEIVTTLDVAVDAPATDHCGTCRACLDACPTAAFIAPYQMDASRCISYLTIEHRGETIPAEFGEATGDWVFGCDICQQVCPHNSKAAATTEPRFKARAETIHPDLQAMIDWSDEDYREMRKGSAIQRAKPAMLRRNARIALANQQRNRENP